MTGTFGAADLEVFYTQRFLRDAADLPDHLRGKVESSAGMIRRHGIYQSGVLAEKIAGQPDARFRFLRVDLQYRMVAVVEGKTILLLKVGNHDDTERWGETAKATIREWADRVDSAEVELGGRGRTRRVDQPTLLEAEPSLNELAHSPVLASEITVCVDGVLDGWANGTIEDWMLFLSPVQRRAVDRAVNGPARVTGGPGTGKSVVALHRAAEFARSLDAGQKLLVTSYVSTVPDVMHGLFERLAPDLADRVEFRTVHSLAKNALDARQAHAEIDLKGQQALARFKRSLHATSARFDDLKYKHHLGDNYLYDEVTWVIEGRGVADLETYLALDRFGRERSLGAGPRTLIWDLYLEYRTACANPAEPLMTWEQVVAAAIDAVRNEPAPRYAAIIVDEAQDITETGMRFLLELLDGGNEGRILVVGDAGQRVYPGGWRLADLGLEVRGRAFTLSVSYRSTDEIMKAVGALGKFLSPHEFGDDGLRSLASSTVRMGPKPQVRSFLTKADQAAWITGEINPDDPDMDGSAILVYSNAEVDAWRRRLSDAGIGTVPLTSYQGRAIPGVKVGTFHRAKGLEFERVFLPDLDASFPLGDRKDEDLIVAKGSVLYVAMSRARDRLLLSHTGAPSMFLEPVIPFCDVIDEAAEPAEVHLPDG